MRWALRILALPVAYAPILAEAASGGANYDMSRFLSEPHPFDRPYAPASASVPQPPAPRSAPAASPFQPAAPAAAAPGPTPVAQAAQPASRPAAPGPATQPAKAPDNWRLFSELRGGLLAHDVGPFSHKKEDGVDVNAEVLFTSPRFMELIWSPRPTIGATINTSGDTSQGYLGLTWEWDFWEHAYFSFFWGGAAHNGEKVVNLPDKKDLGCSVLFREGLDLGWRFGEHHAVMAHFSHISNAKICDANEGLETIGLRYGYRF